MSEQKVGSPTVFISYAHEDGLNQQVDALVDWLSGNGFNVIADKAYRGRMPPQEGWQAWMQRGIRRADLVLIVCTERYRGFFEKEVGTHAGGCGATWEGAIITQQLYDTGLINDRFLPVLPDGGSHQHVPEVLRPWFNSHSFPSRQHDIRATVLGLPPSAGPHTAQPLLPGELVASDTRLHPREDVLIGRGVEVDQVVAFLCGSAASAAVYGHVTGSGGIGKTEVCKAALREWLAGGPQVRAFWIQLDDDSNSCQLLQRMAAAVGLSDEVVAGIERVEQLRTHLPAGLYYLDNLESVAEQPDGRAMLRQLSQLPGVRLLASSRVSLEGVLGQPIEIDRLATDDAVALFQRCWNGSALDDSAALHEFCDQQLGGYPLAITQMARMGKRFGSLARLQQEWERQGTQLAGRRACDRLDSLKLSFDLTRRQLANEAGALALWQFAALFGSEGFDDETLQLWESVSSEAGAAEALLDHYVLRRQGDRFSLLPPLTRYALSDKARQPGNDFDWGQASQWAYDYFLRLTEHASDIVSSERVIQARLRAGGQLRVVHQLLQFDVHCLRDKSKISKLNEQLRNVYIDNLQDGRAVLLLIVEVAVDSLALLCLGDLERRSGSYDQARLYYERARDGYLESSSEHGLAYALKGIGELDSKSGYQNLVNCLIQITQHPRHNKAR